MRRSSSFSCCLKSLLAVLTVCCLVNFTVTAQEKETTKNKFTKVAALEGLKVKCILQDRYGFMWFGTETGLYRYDGYNTQALKNYHQGSSFNIGPGIIAVRRSGW